MNIYVGNLSLDCSEDDLRREFSAFGEVASVTLMDDKYIGSGQLIAYGFVEMTSTAEGTAAIAGLNGKTFFGRELDLVEALPLSEKKDRRFGRSGMSTRKRHR